MKTAGPPHNPFPGLRPFRSDEHHLFFGREEQTAALLQLLRSNRFLAVVGTSGSGKSSLVRAGMIAELHGGTMTHAGSTWEVMILRPGGSPIENLARAFVDAGLYDPEDPSTLPRLLATLGRSRFGLVEAMKQSEVFEPGTNLLVLVDQFEELFRFRQQGVDSEETAAAFVNLLLTAGEQAECPIYVTITMRSDYLGDCSEIPGLAEAVNEGEYLIPRLGRDQKREAIEKPIGVGGARISPLLVQRLLNEVGDDPDQLPVLQHALMRTWDAWSARGDHHRPIDFGDFEATGGLGTALSNHADEIFDALPDERHRSACEKIFKALTEKGDDNRGIRRPTRLARLQAIAASDKETVTRVLDTYRGAGVTFLMPGTEVAMNARTVLDLSHESLMRGWQRLRGWVEDEAQSARIFRRLLDTARLWSDGKAGLFRDPDLQIAVSWREQEVPNVEWAEQYGGHLETAIGFLETSNAEVADERQARESARQRELDHARQLAESQRLRLEQEQRATRRLRKLIAGMALVALIAGLACVAALVARNDAGRLARVAEEEADKARQNEVETATALALVESQKAKVEGSLSKAEAAERLARAAEEAGRKLLYTTDMRLAPFVWGDDRTTAEQLRSLLAKHIPDPRDAALKPDLRGFEWHYYQHLLERSAAVFSGHGVPVIDGTLTSNGRLVTVDSKGQVRRWDVDSRDEEEAGRRDLPGGPGAQVRVLSPDGRLAALAEANKVHVFDTARGKETRSIDSDPNRSRRLIFSPAGDRLVIVDGKIRWCDAASGEVIASVNQKFGRGSSLALSADGLTLAVVGHGPLGNHFSIFRLVAAGKTATPLAKDVGFGGTLNAAALSPDGRRIAVSARLTGSLYIFDTATGRAVAQHGSAHASPVSTIAFSREGAKLATGDTQGTIKIWDAPKFAPKGVPLRTLKGHQAAINSGRFSADGKRLVTTSVDGTARVWDLENAGAAIRPLERSGASVVARFSADGQLIAAADGSAVRLWDAATGRLVRELSAGDNSRIHSVAFSPTDSRLLAVGHGGQAGVSHVTLWDSDAGRELARLPGATDLPDFEVDEYAAVVGALAFSPDGKYLVAGFGSKQLFTPQRSPNPLKVWEVATRRLVRRLEGHTGYCLSLDFSRNGTLLASASRDGTAILWSTETWGPVRTLQNSDKGGEFADSAKGMFEDVAFSPDGKTLALASYEGTVQLWDVATGRVVDTLKGHSSAVSAVAFSPDGRTLASGGGDQTVRLWNVETRRELMRLDPGGVGVGSVSSLAFSPDGKQLLAGGRGTTACWSAASIVWDDADRAAARLRLLLRTNADFPSRIRMLSENLRLREALARLDAKDARVRAALAATQANWHASRNQWPEAVLAFDRLVAADPAAPEAWLRTPGLLRLATALLHRNRADDAARVLQGGASRRSRDGVPPIVKVDGFGLRHVFEDRTVRITEVEANSPASRAGLLPGDIVVRVNGTRVTRETVLQFGLSTTLIDLWAAGGRLQASSPWMLALHAARLNASGEGADFDTMLGGDVGTTRRLTVRHPGSTRTEDIDLVKENYRRDAATGELFFPLLEAVEKRLAKAPRDGGLLEMRAELAGQEGDFARQATDYTAALEILAERPAGAAPARLQRIRLHRGDAYVGLQRWREAVDDYAHLIAPATTDPRLLANRARAYEGLEHWDAAAADWVRAASGNPEGGKWLGDFARRLAAGSRVPPTKGRLEKSRTLYERLLEAAPGNEAIAAELARVLLEERASGGWTVLEPTELKSEGGATLRRQSDGSILASGKNPDRDLYTVVARPGLGRITAIRLEVLPDPSLPKNGPGRYVNGNFHLSKLCVFSGGEPAPLTNILVTAAEDQHFRNLTDGRIYRSQGWGTWNREGQQHTAFIATDLRSAPDADLKIELYFSRAYSLGHNLGRFRLSVRGDDGAFEREEDRLGASADPWLKLAAAYAANGRNEEASKYFGVALERAAISGAWQPIFELAARYGDLLSALLERRPDQPQLQLDLARKFMERGKQQLAAGRPEKAQAGLEKARQIYTQLLAKYPKPKWLVLTPIEMKTETGAKLELQRDGSVFAYRNKPYKKDTYRLTFRSESKGIKGLRLEVLTDSRLPKGGPGWAKDGTFVLGGLTLRAAPAGASAKFRAIGLRNAAADYSSGGGDVRYAIDGKAGLGWSIYHEAGKDHTAVFELAEEVGDGPTSQLRVRLSHASADHNLGRFRLSFTDDAATLRTTRIRLDLKESEALDLCVALGTVYARQGRTNEAVGSFAEALRLAADRAGKARIIAEAARLAGVLEKLVPHLAEASAAGPEDTALSLHVAALQAWFGQEKELAATRRRSLAFAGGTHEAATAERAATASSILPTPDKAQLEAALALGRRAVELGKGGARNLLALGMAEYRSGNYAAADKALLAAAAAGPRNPYVTGISGFYRAMSLFRQGKKDEARKLALTAAAKSMPSPGDEKNPLVGDAGLDDLILRLAYREARAMIDFDASPPPKGKEGKK